MGVRIYKEKKAEHLLPEEIVNLWPWFREEYGKRLTVFRDAYRDWQDHREGLECLACKKGRDGGIYVCDELNYADVVYGYINHHLYVLRSTVKRVSRKRLTDGRVLIWLKEMPEQPLAVPAETVVEIRNHLYDPDKDSLVQPPKRLFPSFPLAG